MFDKLKENLIKKIAEQVYKGRDVAVVKIGKQFFVTCRDQMGAFDDFLLKGTYSYDQVMELTKIMGRYASFGFCEGIGPVALIGKSNDESAHHNGYFRYKIHEYGTKRSDDECYFTCYTDDEAKGVGNYTVYGMRDPRELQGAAPIDKVCYIYDYRYNCKDSHSEDYVRSVLRMDVKLAGTYTFNEARMLAYGSTKEPDGYTGDQIPIQFAIAGGEPVGILNVWREHDDKRFRDVWGKGEEEPKEVSLHFLSDYEAKEINSFKLYFYEMPYSFDRSKYNIEKIDRTLEPGFDFTMEDGTDYRLKTSVKKNKVYTKTK